MQQLEHLPELQRKANSRQAVIAVIDVRASSTKGELGVNVDAQGRVTDIRLPPKRSGSAKTASQPSCSKTIRDARGVVARRADEIAKPFTSDPGISAALDAVREFAEKRVGVVPPYSVGASFGTMEKRGFMIDNSDVTGSCVCGEGFH